MGKFSEEDKQRIKDLRTSGKSYRYISREFKANWKSVYLVVNPDTKTRYMSKEYESRYSAEWQNKRRILAINLLGGCCVRCGMSDFRCLQIDHIVSCGRNNRESGSKIYRAIVNNTEEAKTRYQILCANCNWIKKYENKENINNIRYSLY